MTATTQSMTQKARMQQLTCVQESIPNMGATDDL
jgi:hypothetical protein